MKTEDINIGDIVYLNSGSPSLTVAYKGTDDDITVNWISSNLETIQSARFKPEMLTLIEPQNW